MITIEYPSDEDLAQILIELTNLLNENKTILPLTAEEVLHEIKIKKLPEAMNRLDRFVKKTNLSIAMKTLLSKSDQTEETKKTKGKLLGLAQVRNWLLSDDEDGTSQRKDNPRKESYLVNSKPYRGRVLILNNSFSYSEKENVNQSSSGNVKKEDKREGSEFDVKRLTNALTELNYDVHLREELTSDEMKGEIEDFLNKDEHRECDAVGVVIMTHGGSGDVLHGIKDKDDKLALSDVLQLFCNKNSLFLKKPKFLIIQSCRGPTPYNQPPGLPDDLLQPRDGNVQESECESGISNYKLPPDMLLMHAALPEFLAIRNAEKGTLFIQALCDVMENYGKVTPIEQWFPLITKKNQEYQKESYDPKHVVAPQFVFTLTKQFYLDTALPEENK